MTHGTENAYKKHGCRCEACREANADAQRARRHAKGEHVIQVKREALAELLQELFPLGLTDDCPARRHLRSSG